MQTLEEMWPGATEIVRTLKKVPDPATRLALLKENLDVPPWQPALLATVEMDAPCPELWRDASGRPYLPHLVPLPRHLPTGLEMAWAIIGRSDEPIGEPESFGSGRPGASHENTARIFLSKAFLEIGARGRNESVAMLELKFNGSRDDELMRAVVLLCLRALDIIRASTPA